MIGLIWMSLAMAQSPCGPTLQRTLEQASTLAVPQAYVDLAQCDAERARQSAPVALEKMFGDDNEAIAVVSMVDVGALDSLVPWLGRIPPDDRLSMLRAIGEGCADKPERNAFFATIKDQKGERFFVDRWYRGLDRCRTPEARAILTDALDSQRFGIEGTDRGGFLDILEVYTRNLRTEALPLLERYARELDDDEEIAYVLQIMPRAAGYDTPEGVDADEARQVGQLIFDLGDRLDPTRIDIARAVLGRIDQEDVANSLVRYRWPDAWRVGGGRYHYGAVAVQTYECRPGKLDVRVHSGEFAEDGRYWPDALIAQAPERLEAVWTLDDPPCDVQPTTEITLSPTPLKTGEDREQWLSAQRVPYTARVKKRKVTFMEHEPFAW